VWLLVGTGLATVGVRFVFGWNETDSQRTALGIGIALALGCLAGAAKGRYVLARTARRNKRRIAKLNAPRVWQVFTGRFVIVILLMIALGRGLRALAADGWLGGRLGVGGLYVGIGMALAVAARAYFIKPPPPMPTRLDAAPGKASARPPEPMPTRLDAAPGKSSAVRGVLLVNLGSPAAPTPRAVRAFLRQFLGDPRVVEVNRLLWAFVLNVMILPFRSGTSAALYRSIWTEEGSPLIVVCRRLQRALARRLGDQRPVALGMRYGEPSLGAALDELDARGCDEILVVSLFPQESNTTTGSVVAEVNRLAAASRKPPAIAYLPSYCDDPAFIDALAARADAYPAGDFTVFSFHGIPESYVRQGDPYLEQCGRTAWALAQRLGLPRDEWEMVFQSRFGDEPWLQPYLDEYVPGLATSHPRVRVIAPSFTADCLETLEEITLRLGEDFARAGGSELIVVPCLNDDAAWVEALAAFVERSCGRGG